jgi:O-antigen/teichoic acid export membrane protein
VISLVSGPVIARLAGPVPFGIFAPVLSLNAVGNIFSESGLSYHVLTSKDISIEGAKDLHYRSVYLAIIAGLIAAPFCAAIGHVPTDQRIFRGVATFVLIVLAGLASIPSAWAQRKGQLGKISWYMVLFSGASTAAAIPLGMLGFGLGAVVMNNLLIPLLTPISSWRLAKFSGVVREPAHIDLKYRVGTLLAGVTYFLASGADLFILATYLDTGTLGIYGRVTMFSALPGNVVFSALSRVGIVHLAHANTRQERYSFVLKGVGLTAASFSFLLIPALLGLNLPGLFFGSKFAIPPSAFAKIVGANGILFSSNMISTYFQARRQYGPVTLPYVCQAIVSLGGFLALRPTSFQIIGDLLLAAAVVRLLVMTGVGFNLVRGEKDQPADSMISAPEDVQ